jgi:phosphatidylserine decarboxylase
MLRSEIPPLHAEGWKFLAIFAFVTLVLFQIWQPLGWLGVVLTLWCAWFFRDPVRFTPLRAGLVISPADGRIEPVKEAVPPAELGMGPSPRTRISIFMNVFDVHVNRSPCDGEVAALHYRPGKFFNASLDKASEDNERQSIRLLLDDGSDIAVVQVAGLIARRILCPLSVGKRLLAGERFGMIRFGSRVDVYLADGMVPLVAAGQRAIGGETVIADARVSEPPRRAATR